MPQVRLVIVKPDMHASRVSYRPDIDGLRAVAILSVLAFHGWPETAKSGFIGVDIFFVISGFLISNIIFARRTTSGFKYLDFYVGRIKRIFPSLILVLAASAALGWFVLFTVEYRELGLQLAAASTFTSNLVLWLGTGYFDSAANLKPLLHLWSLGVEEQFYLVWPLVVLLGLRSNAFGLVIGSIGLLSFGACVLLSYSKFQSMAFYMPFSRFWELATGGLLAYRTLNARPPGGKTADWLSAAGVACYMLGLTTTTGDTVFPGYVAVLPVLAGTLLIAAGPGAFVNRRLLAHPAMVGVGLISYPLYLWHWPLLVYFRTLHGGPLSRVEAAVPVVMAFVLAALSYQFVEKRVRSARHARAVALSLCLVMACIGMAGAGIYRADGLAARAINTLNPSDRVVGSIGGDLVGCENMSAAIRSLPYCLAQRGGEPTYAMLGDSKAAALFPGVLDQNTSRGRWMLVGGHGANGSPLPVLSDAAEYAAVQPMTVAATDLIARTASVKVVVLVMATRELFLTDDRFLRNLNASPNADIAYDGLDRTVGKFVSAGKTVVIVEDNPSLEESAVCLPRKTASALINRYFAHSPGARCSISEVQIEADTLIYRRVVERLAEKWTDKLFIFSPFHSLCDSGTKLCSSVKDGHALYSYTDHVSAYGARLEAADLMSVVSEVAH